MTEARRRRPLPAVICLAALTLLTALVWWRVLNRDDSSASASSSCTADSNAVVLPQPNTVSVSVLNSTNRKGIAASASTALTQRGFQVTGYANDKPPAILGVAEIRFSPDQKLQAALLEYYFPKAKQVALAPNTSQVLIVSLGNLYKAVTPTTSVKAALTAAHVSLAPTAGSVDSSNSCSS